LIVSKFRQPFLQPLVEGLLELLGVPVVLRMGGVELVAILEHFSQVAQELLYFGVMLRMFR